MRLTIDYPNIKFCRCLSFDSYDCYSTFLTRDLLGIQIIIKSFICYVLFANVYVMDAILHAVDRLPVVL